MIRMYFALRPSRRIEAFSLERNQHGLFFHLEHFPGPSPSGSVDAPASYIAAPDQGATRYVVEIDKGLSLEEALSCVMHIIFNDGLVLGMDRPRRIGQKAPIAGVLEKSPVETRCVRIALIDTSFHSVHDDAPGTTTKKRQSAFEAIDDGGQILLENGSEPHGACRSVIKR